MFKWIRIAAMCLLATPAFSQWYSINVDSQAPKTDYLIPFRYAGTAPFLKSFHYQGYPNPTDMTLWACELDLFCSASPTDTNGVFIIPGVSAGSNEVDYTSATNVFYPPRDYVFYIKATSPAGSLQILASGRVQVLYTPAVSTNLYAMMQAINVQFLTNWIGQAVGSNTVNIAALTTTFNSTSGQVTTALGTLTTNLASEVVRATGAENTIQSNLTTAVTNQAATNALLLASILSNQSQISSNLTLQTNTDAYLQGEIAAIVVGTSNSVFRYYADSTTGETVSVLASASGITASQDGLGTFTFVNPNSAKIVGAVMCVSGPNTVNGKIYLAFDTGDFDNSTMATMVCPTVSCFRESDGQPVTLTAHPYFNPTYSGLIVISGMNTSASEVFHISLTFP